MSNLWMAGPYIWKRVKNAELQNYLRLFVNCIIDVDKDGPLRPLDHIEFQGLGYTIRKMTEPPPVGEKALGNILHLSELREIRVSDVVQEPAHKTGSHEALQALVKAVKDAGDDGFHRRKARYEKAVRIDRRFAVSVELELHNSDLKSPGQTLDIHVYTSNDDTPDRLWVSVFDGERSTGIESQADMDKISCFDDDVIKLNIGGPFERYERPVLVAAHNLVARTTSVDADRETFVRNRKPVIEGHDATQMVCRLNAAVREFLSKIVRTRPSGGGVEYVPE